MVVYAVGKPHLLQISQKAFIFGTLFVPFIILIYLFEGGANGKVILAVLVGEDVTAI